MSLSNSINRLAEATRINDEKFIQDLINFLENGEEVSVNFFTLSCFFEEITRINYSDSIQSDLKHSAKTVHDLLNDLLLNNDVTLKSSDLRDIEEQITQPVSAVKAPEVTNATDSEEKVFGEDLNFDFDSDLLSFDYPIAKCDEVLIPEIIEDEQESQAESLESEQSNVDSEQSNVDSEEDFIECEFESFDQRVEPSREMLKRNFLNIFSSTLNINRERDSFYNFLFEYIIYNPSNMNGQIAFYDISVAISSLDPIRSQKFESYLDLMQFKRLDNRKRQILEHYETNKLTFHLEITDDFLNAFNKFFNGVLTCQFKIIGRDKYFLVKKGSQKEFEFQGMSLYEFSTSELRNKFYECLNLVQNERLKEIMAKTIKGKVISADDLIILDRSFRGIQGGKQFYYDIQELYGGSVKVFWKLAKKSA